MNLVLSMKSKGYKLDITVEIIKKLTPNQMRYQLSLQEDQFKIIKEINLSEINFTAVKTT